VGYPNTGKSSVINTLKKKKVVNTAPIPGETKVWQYVTLMKRIYLVDSPGVVPASDCDHVEAVLKGVVRAERLPNPTLFISPILENCQEKHIRSAYTLPPHLTWEDGDEFLEVLGKRWGRLMKGGDVNTHTTAVQVINDWQRVRDKDNFSLIHFSNMIICLISISYIRGDCHSSYHPQDLIKRKKRREVEKKKKMVMRKEINQSLLLLLLLLINKKEKMR